MASAEERRASADYIAKHGRIRPSHAVRNDAKLDTAIVAVIAENGWDDLSVNKVAKAAGLTPGAVYKRHADKTALGIHAWDRLLRTSLTDAIDAVITAGLAAGIPAPDANEASATTLPAFAAAMQAFIHPAPGIRAALELVMGSQFDPAQRAAIFEPAATWLRERCQPDGGDNARAAQATAIAVWALGLILVSNRPWTDSMDTAPAIARIHGALAHPATPTPLPANSAGYLRGTPFDTGDPRVDTILMSILESVGAIGYQRTHVVTATDAAQVSETFAFMRYPTKLDLFLAVIQTGYAQAYDDIRAFRESVAAEHGIGLAEAVTWREYLAPDVAERRIASIETDRLTLHNPRMRQTAIAADIAILDSILLDVPKDQRSAMTGHLHLDFASGHGLPLIGILLPDSWQLPFDVVTVPETARHPMPS